MTILAAGFLLGVAASLHCVVMCGPLMSVVLGGRRSRAAIIYHGARVTSYALLGVLTGTIGHVAVLAGAGRVLSVIVGLALIWSAAVRAGWLRSRASSRAHSSASSSGASSAGSNAGSSADASLGLSAVSGMITAAIARAARAVRATGHGASPVGIAAAGVLNGLLPCGAVYAALAAATALGDAGLSMSAGFMIAFGAGTLPALLFAGEIAARAAQVAGARWRQAAPAALVILGVLLTARGLMPSHQHEASNQAHAHVHSAAVHTPSR